MKKLLMTTLAGLGLMAAALTAAQAQDAKAGDAKAGEKKAAMCIGCHGIPGYKTAFPDVYHVPKIAGDRHAVMFPRKRPRPVKEQSRAAQVAAVASVPAALLARR